MQHIRVEVVLALAAPLLSFVVVAIMNPNGHTLCKQGALVEGICTNRQSAAWPLFIPYSDAIYIHACSMPWTCHVHASDVCYCIFLWIRVCAPNAIIVYFAHFHYVFIGKSAAPGVI
ncbi:hypothetical protein BGX38DRAFT_1162675 [Terfezia claveryi]|nr:hypothetical protein BGX38DRAFT_1162675 [Terfezia claveryi]